jgi:hypothetical protein
MPLKVLTEELGGIKEIMFLKNKQPLGFEWN